MILNATFAQKNKRANDIINPEYKETFVFENDFSAFLPPIEIEKEIEEISEEEKRLLVAKQVNGICEVMCFSPKHNLTLAEMDTKDIQIVIKEWKKQYQELGSKEEINYVQIFENKGSVMGCSNPHPHCQIWASSFIPQEPQIEMESMNKYKNQYGSCLLCDYVNLEKKKQLRIIVENEDFLAVVPFWALWPYEVLLLSKSHLGNLSQFSEGNMLHLSDSLKRITCKYDNLFDTSFPYSMGIHQTPTDKEQHNESHFHIHFYPPLLRSATVKKFMVGYEMLGEPQRDLTPELCAHKLQELSDSIHYKKKQ